MSRASASQSPEVSFVVPAFNEEGQIESFTSVLLDVCLHQGISSFEIIFVDDGSFDGSWSIIQRLVSEHHEIRGLRLIRNFGKEAALVAGLTAARGRCVVPMDCDLQDPPVVAVQMVELWRQGHLVVVGRRDSRDESFGKRFFAGVFYRLLSRISSTEIPRDVGDFRALDRSVVQHFLAMQERSRYNKGLLALAGPKPAVVAYARPASSRRLPSALTLTRLIALATRGLVSFSTAPLRVLSAMGFVTLFLTILGIMAGLALRQLGIIEIPGQATVVIGVLLILGFQALSSGLLGEYLAQTLIEAKARPAFWIVDEIGTSNE